MLARMDGAPVAQLDRATVFGTVGWGFESLRAESARDRMAASHFASIRGSSAGVPPALAVQRARGAEFLATPTTRLERLALAKRILP
jgi:hypothetical protein